MHLTLKVAIGLVIIKCRHKIRSYHSNLLNLTWQVPDRDWAARTLAISHLIQTSLLMESKMHLKLG